MMKPAEAVGAVPQPGVNPAARQAPAQPPQGGGPLSPEDVEALRGDKEVAEVFRQVAGAEVPMDQVDPQSLAEVAGMVEKLGVDGAVQAINAMLSPEQKASLQAEAAKAGGQQAPPAATAPVGGQL